MKKLLAALTMALPLYTAAADVETTPQPNAQNADIVTAKDAIKAKDWNTAITALHRAAKSEPGNADVHNYLGYSYRNANKIDLAFKHYNEALRIDPNHRGANEYIGIAYLKSNNPAKAEEHLAKLEKICGKKCDEYQDLGKAIAEYRKK